MEYFVLRVDLTGSYTADMAALGKDTGQQPAELWLNMHRTNAESVSQSDQNSRNPLTRSEMVKHVGQTSSNIVGRTEYV